MSQINVLQLPYWIISAYCDRWHLYGVTVGWVFKTTRTLKKKMAVHDDIDSLRRHVGGVDALPYVDFQEQDAVAQALCRWPLLRAYVRPAAFEATAPPGAAPGT